MDVLVAKMHEIAGAIDGFLWREEAMVAVLAIGLLFTLWSCFCQWRALTHGTMVTLGFYSHRGEPGAISHFQALSAALSATIGLGNIGGVALSVAIGGPGAVFWMWVVGFVGMALKTTEVTLAMMYRNLDNPENPHGGAMYVVDRGLKKWSPRLAPLGKAIAVLFCVCLLVSTVTGGNMFQAWNVAEATHSSFGVPRLGSGIVLGVLCALVTIGGIKRIGAVAGSLVPFMCVIYLAGAVTIICMNYQQIPGLFALIFRSAFSPSEAQGAFLGGTVGSAFLLGLKRAFFSNEAGQGSSPIAHCAARTDEPVSEGLVAGLEPFIDTLVICTITALVILSSGVWNRGPEARYSSPVTLVEVEEGKWQPRETHLPSRLPEGHLTQGEGAFLIATIQTDAGEEQARIEGSIVTGSDGKPVIEWQPVASKTKPVIEDHGLYHMYNSAALTSHAFDREIPGFGRWMVTLAIWLFALSTVISWSYYGEQGMVYLFGERVVPLYRIGYCLCLVIACGGFVTSDLELEVLSSIGTGVMLYVNLPICLLFAGQTMREYHRYIARLKAGELNPPNEPPPPQASTP